MKLILLLGIIYLVFCFNFPKAWICFKFKKLGSFSRIKRTLIRNAIKCVRPTCWCATSPPSPGPCPSHSPCPSSARSQTPGTGGGSPYRSLYNIKLWSLLRIRNNLIRFRAQHFCLRRYATKSCT